MWSRSCHSSNSSFATVSDVGTVFAKSLFQPSVPQRRPNDHEHKQNCQSRSGTQIGVGCF